jgi:hypothetical protein
MFLAMGAVARRDFDDARRIVAQLRRFSATDHLLSMAEMLAARVEGAAGEPGTARAHAEAAVTVAHRSRFPLRIAQALDLLARVTLRNDLARARAAYNEMVDVDRAHPHLERVAGQHTIAMLTSAQFTLAEHQPSQALPALREAAVHASEHGLPLAIRAAFVLAAALSDLDRPEAAATLAGFVTQARYSWYLPWIFWPDDLAVFEVRRSQLRTHVGDASYGAAIAKGAAMSLDDIGAFMVAVIDDVPRQKA